MPFIQSFVICEGKKSIIRKHYTGTPLLRRFLIGQISKLRRIFEIAVRTNPKIWLQYSVFPVFFFIILLRFRYISGACMYICLHENQSKFCCKDTNVFKAEKTKLCNYLFFFKPIKVSFYLVHPRWNTTEICKEILK